jgi:thiol:disulfide interchange protein DsbD
VESFFSGVLATLVATPCTAPFMGSALGFALSQPAAGALMIFAGLGIGMAVPYVLLSFFPQLGRYLPKPGAWMESFKQWMAFPLFATVIWLLWVLGLQVDIGGVTALLVALLAIAMAAWIYGRWGSPSRAVSVQWIARGAALILVLGGLAYARENLQIAETEGQSGAVKTDAYGQVWEPYSPERIEALRAEGRPIYIDFTAAWCATCQVNKRLVFGSEEVRAKIKELNMALVKGDWTRRDPVITKALESFDRAGVPLNVLYGKGPDARPKVLPEVLTAGIVLEAFKGL